MACRILLFLCLFVNAKASVPASKIEEVVSGTAHVIGTLQNESQTAKARFSDPSKFDAEVDKIGHHEASKFDVKLYSAKKQAFSEFAQQASELAKKSMHTKNATVAEEVLDGAEEQLKKMTKVGDELDAMEKDFHDQLQGALDAKLNPELKTTGSFTTQASHLQKEAHSMMDPLYGWGDSAEDKADGLNDQTNDALSSVDKVVRTYRRHIVDHTRAVQRDVERKLFVGQDRTAEWRKVQSLVRSATGHVFMLQFLAEVGLMGLPVTRGYALLMATSMAAAAVCGLAVGFMVKSRSPRSDEYQFLSA